jgi:hypothetical protein
MTVNLVPGYGARLSPPWPPLPFGLAADDVRHALAERGPVSDTFVCGAAWALGCSVPGLSITLSAGWSGEGLEIIAVSRRSPAADAWPVAVFDVDVFGWPAGEVVEYLSGQDLPPPVARRGSARFGDLWLSGHDRFDHAVLYASLPR